MYKVMMIVDGTAYCYGKWADRKVANEIALEVREQRQVDTYVEKE
jgi:hypothetical protein